MKARVKTELSRDGVGLADVECDSSDEDDEGDEEELHLHAWKLSVYGQCVLVQELNLIPMTYVDARDRSCAKMFRQKWSTGRLIL